MIVTIIGTGYVGLVTGVCLASTGHVVRCVEVSRERLAMILGGKAPFFEPELDGALRRVLASGCFSATADAAEAMFKSELTLIAVGTPPDGENADLSYLKTAASQVGEALRHAAPYHVIGVKSTVLPGTTRGIVGPIVEQTSGLRLGDFGLAMNPEFLREGSAMSDFMNPDRIVIGQADAASGNVIEALYAPFQCEKFRVGLEEAELIKYASNSLLGVLISFSNELAALSEATPGADLESVMRGLYLDRRLSPRLEGERIEPEILGYLRGGIGFGGSCLPKDVNALRTYGKQTGVPTPVLDAVMTTNVNRAAQIVALAESALGGFAGKTVAVLGVAFKAGTDDLRSSPSLAIIRRIADAGARVRAFDPLISGRVVLGIGMEGICCDTIERAVTGADAVLIATADSAFRFANWFTLGSLMRSPIVLDGRNVLREAQLPNWIEYRPIGKGEPVAEAALVEN